MLDMCSEREKRLKKEKIDVQSQLIANFRKGKINSEISEADVEAAKKQLDEDGDIFFERPLKSSD